MIKTPKLRFKEFSGDWESKKVASVFDRVSNKVDVIEDEYYEQIGIRSHGKGIFYKEPVSGKELGNKRVFWVEPDVFVVNIVFAWEQAVAKTTQNEVGMIASHRFPMYRPKENILDLDYITQLFKTPKGKFLLGLASPGGAGRNKTLGQKEFDNLDIVLPSYDEQKKISTFISLIDKKIIKQGEKIEALKDYKTGMMQKIFSRELRFKNVDGNYYPTWEENILESLCTVKKGAQLNKDLLEKNGNYYALNGGTGPSGYTNKYNVTEETISISEGGNSCGYVNYNFEKFWSGGHCYTLEYVSNNINNRYLYQFLKYNQLKIMSMRVGTGLPNIQKGSISNFKVEVACMEEQIKISELLFIIDRKLKKEQEKLDSLKEYKSGLLQQMFI